MIKLLEQIKTALRRRPASQPPPELVEREQDAERCYRAALIEMQGRRLDWDPRGPSAPRTVVPTLDELEDRVAEDDRLMREALGRG